MSTDDNGPDGGLVETIDQLPLVQNLAAGVGAFTSGYALFVALLAVSGSPNFATPVSTLKELGNLYFNAQNIGLLRREVVTGEQTITRESTVNLIQSTDPSLPPVVYYLVPIVAITIVAALVAARYVDTSQPLKRGAGVVGGLSLGYVLAALVGTVLVAQRTSMEGASETLAPELVSTLAFGALYPLVVGTIVVGSYVGWRRRWKTRAGPRPADQA